MATIHVIEVGSEAYNKIIDEVVQTTIKQCQSKLKASNDDVLLKTGEALKMLNISSKSKLKQLREAGRIKAVTYGKGSFRYSKKSIQNFLSK